MRRQMEIESSACYFVPASNLDKKDVFKKLFDNIPKHLAEYYKDQITAWKKDKRITKSEIVCSRLNLKMAFYYHYLKEAEKEFACCKEAYRSVVQLLSKVFNNIFIA